MNKPTDAPVEASAVMPCLNEERTLAACIRKAQRSFADLGIRGEVIVADNGSTDRSREIAESLGARVVQQPIKGYGATLICGVEASRGSIIIVADADDSYDWSDIGRFVVKIKEGYDLVNGNRFTGGIERGAMPWHHKYIGNPVLSLISRVVFKAPISDFHCGMRAFTRQAWKVMQLRTMGFETCTEMIGSAARSGLRMSEIPIRLYPDGRERRPHLRSFRDGWINLRFILTYAPDHLYLIPGGLMFLVGFLLQAILLQGPVTMFGRFFGIHYLALAGLLTLIGFNVTFMGLISKVLMSLKFPLLRSRWVDWALSDFKLEHGLIAGCLLAIPGLAAELWILSEWLQSAARMTNRTIHIAFIAANAIALGTNLIFSSFVLNLLTDHHADINVKTNVAI